MHAAAAIGDRPDLQHDRSVAGPPAIMVFL